MRRLWSRCPCLGGGGGGGRGHNLKFLKKIDQNIFSGNGHSPGETQDEREVSVSPGEMESTEDLGYIRPDLESPIYVWSVTGSLLFGSPLKRVRGLQQPTLPSRDPTWMVCWWVFGTPVV